MTSALQKLKELNLKVNNGNGINTVAVIVSALEKGNLEVAQIEWTRDGDKIPSWGEFAEMRKLVVELLGCRVHLIKDCQNKLCLRFK